MNYPRVSIIILNWNGWRDTIECLESLYRITYPNYDVIVVDNGSKDESIQKIREYAEGKIQVSSKFFEYNPKNKPIEVFDISEDDAREGRFNKPLYEKHDADRRMILIKNKNNYGFAGGNNAGIKFALSVLNPDYVLLLNNDTVVDKRFLDELVKVAESDEKIGIVGPKILYYNNPKIINSAGGRVNWKLGLGENIGIGEVDKGQHNEVRDVDYAHGAGMLIKTEIFHKIGLLNENFFILLEDTDFCIRAKQANYKVLYYPYTRIYHKEGASRGEKSAISLYYQNRNRILFSRKYSKKWIPYVTLRGLIGTLIIFFKENSHSKAWAIFSGLMDGIS